MPNKLETFTKLIPQSLVQNAREDWHRAVFGDIKSRLAEDSSFPCLFSKNAFRKDLLKFIFVESADNSGMRHLADGLFEYVALSREWNGSLDTAHPLIVAFSLEAIKSQSVEDYHDFGWMVLQKLHEIDPAPWPTDVGADPDAPSWSMCFNGMPLFFNMSHPAHRVRRSRNLGEHFVFVVNPRERFDIIAGDTPAGRRVRSNIRSRIGRYDGVEHCPQLASYEAGGIEWWQYGITDENSERTDKCPFRFVKS
jgi:N-omega-hydroxy-L-arginine synthase